MTTQVFSVRRTVGALLAAALLSTALSTSGTVLAETFQECMRKANTEKDLITRANKQALCGSEQVLDAGVDVFETTMPIIERGACELVDKPIYGKKYCN